MRKLVILVMGLSGSGKTSLAKKLFNSLNKEYKTLWLNADKERSHTHNDDFSLSGRMKQSIHIRDVIEKSEVDIVICDLIAPTPSLRRVIDPDIIVWMDTVSESKYLDTDSMFIPPTSPDFVIRVWGSNDHTKIVSTTRRLLWK
jgi:GTPase SAR1 family protein